MRSSGKAAIGSALAAAALFGASTPAAKMLVGDVTPVMLAGLLYAGSGVGLSLWLLARPYVARGETYASLARADLPWLAGAVLCGGIVGPILLMLGLAQIPASTASLLLNLEGAFTALLAWFAFREHFDRRIALGMGLIVAGGVLLSVEPGTAGGPSLGVLAVVGACLAWAIDNNLTRRISGGDAVTIAAIKGAVAGVVNLGIAAVAGAAWPAAGTVAAACLTGLAGYGASLVLFVVALRGLGTARAAAYFSTAPFVGVAVSLAALGEAPAGWFWVAGALMIAGVWLHVSERHEHLHVHEPTDHTHAHVHDEHHAHAHDFGWDGREPHAHPHLHERLAHGHPHYPDIHHRHGHRDDEQEPGETSTAAPPGADRKKEQ